MAATCVSIQNIRKSFSGFVFNLFFVISVAFSSEYLNFDKKLFEDFSWSDSVLVAANVKLYH